MTPRVPPLASGELTLRQLEILAGYDDLNVLLTMVRHPDLCEAWLQLGGGGVRGGGGVTRRVWAVVIRTALRCDCAYEWGQHASRAERAGPTEEEVRRCGDPSRASGRDELSVVLHAVDELALGHRLTDVTRNEPSARFAERDVSVDVQPEGPLPPLGRPASGIRKGRVTT